MPPSRAVTNAKVAQRHQRKQSVAQAKTMGNKFTEKQSHFERRREEEQVRTEQQQKGTNFAGVNEIASGASLLSNREAWGRQDTTLSSYTSGAGHDAAPSPFEVASRGKRRATAETVKALTTQSSATFGFGSRPMPRAALPGSRGSGDADGAVSLGTRSTRRVARFQLGTGGGAEAGGGSASSAMGQRRTHEGDATATSNSSTSGIDHLLGDGTTTADGEPARKLTREEKFREVVSTSRTHRAQLQKERAERDAETIALDAEINQLLHLLPKRSKDEEEREAFARSGTPAVRELLAQYKSNGGVGHTAKRLTIKSSGEFAVTDLQATKNSVSGLDRGEVVAGVVGATNATTDTTTTGSNLEAELDDRSRALLARIRKGTVRSMEEEETATATAAATVVAPVGERRRTAAAAVDPTGGFAEDDFDTMLNQMRLDTRRAHAVDRLLDEEEEAALVAQQELIEMDRRAVPWLGLEEGNQMQFARGEWVRRGGDDVFQMDVGGVERQARDAANEGENEEGVYEDNVDIPSSYEGDSDDDGGDAVSVDEAAFVMDDGADDDKPLASDEAVLVRPVVGSALLDKLLTEIEAIATSDDSGDDAGASEQRQRHFMAILTQLHAYARGHVVEVANVFRLVLIEAERTFLRGQRRALSRPMMLSLAVIANLFPMSDYRHEVSTPFYIFLCSTLMQMKLDSLECVHCYVGLCALLTQSIRSAGGKFVGECPVALFNVLALQLPRASIEPVQYQGLTVPVPMMERGAAALLATSGGGEKEASAATAAGKEEDATKPTTTQWRLLATTHDPEALLLCTYHQLTVLADLYSTVPAFPVALLDPFRAIDALIQKQQTNNTNSNTKSNTDIVPSIQSPAVHAAHATLRSLLEGYAAAVEDHRAPLAMRTFRPRPIRLFEPLLEEREESAVKTEIRELKRDIREDKKRVMRHLTAEATVDRRAREKEQSAVEAQREKKYHQVMNDLQQQQHMMNTVDAIMAKAKGKVRKGISGASAQTGGSGGGAEGGGGGGGGAE